MGFFDKYRDLKPNNIGFDEDDQVKIFDFGLAREIIPEEHSKGQNRLMTGGVGTPRYMAPEVSAMSGAYGFPADVYSYTILLWQMVTAKTPFAHILSPAELASKVGKENERPNIAHVDGSESLKILMESGWSADPTHHPTFSLICNELEKMLNQYDEGNTGCDTRRSYFRRSVSQETGLRETIPGPTLTSNFSIKKKTFYSGHEGSSWNASTSKPKSSNRVSRRMSV
jgi:serine/threonine protein kinase